MDSDDSYDAMNAIAEDNFLVEYARQQVAYSIDSEVSGSHRIDRVFRKREGFDEHIYVAEIWWEQLSEPFDPTGKAASAADASCIFLRFDELSVPLFNGGFYATRGNVEQTYEALLKDVQLVESLVPPPGTEVILPAVGITDLSYWSRLEKVVQGEFVPLLPSGTQYHSQMENPDFWNMF